MDRATREAFKSLENRPIAYVDITSDTAELAVPESEGWRLVILVLGLHLCHVYRTPPTGDFHRRQIAPPPRTAGRRSAVNRPPSAPLDRR